MLIYWTINNRLKEFGQSKLIDQTAQILHSSSVCRHAETAWLFWLIGIPVLLFELCTSQCGSSCHPAVQLRPAPASTCIRQPSSATLLHLQSVIRRPVLLTGNEQMFVNIVRRLKTSWYQWVVTYSELGLVNARVWSLIIMILISKHETREALLKFY